MLSFEFVLVSCFWSSSFNSSISCLYSSLILMLKLKLFFLNWDYFFVVCSFLSTWARKNANFAGGSSINLVETVSSFSHNYCLDISLPITGKLGDFFWSILLAALVGVEKLLLSNSAIKSFAYVTFWDCLSVLSKDDFTGSSKGLLAWLIISFWLFWLGVLVMTIFLADIEKL